jgi:hypothetical protein
LGVWVLTGQLILEYIARKKVLYFYANNLLIAKLQIELAHAAPIVLYQKHVTGTRWSRRPPRSHHSPKTGIVRYRRLISEYVDCKNISRHEGIL